MTAVAEKTTVTEIHTTKMKTVEGHTFCNSGWVDKRQRLFTINSGVDLTDALQTASDLLDAAKTPVFDAGMGTPLVDNPAWLVHHALEAAKAVIDAACEAIRSKEAA